jgi:chromosome segregation ATPase
MLKQIERQIRELQKELTEVQKERDQLRLKPCRGDREIQDKDGLLDGLDKRIASINESIQELGKKRRGMVAASYDKLDHDSP